MALVSFGRQNNIETALSNILTKTGYIDTTGSSFLGGILNAIQSALNTEYGKMYDIADNVDIGRATGQYLDRWGNFHAEPREAISYAKDLSLTNCQVYLDPDVTAGEITTLGEGIVLDNLIFTTENESLSFEAIDQIYIRPDRNGAYARVVCTTPGAVDISAGAITKVNLNLSDISNVLPSAAGTYTLKGTNAYTISSGTELATESDYRYVLLQKAESVGLFNEAKVYSVMDATEVAKIAIMEYRGGANVFIETINVQNAEAVATVIRTALRQYRSLGYCVNVYAPITRYLTGNIRLSLQNEDLASTTQASFLSEFVDSVNSVGMGDPLNLSEIATEIVDSVSNINAARIVSAAYGGRTIVRPNITQKFNEKVLTSEDRLSIS